MREIITPWMTRVDAGKYAGVTPEQAAEQQRQKQARIELSLADALEGVDEKTRQTIRMGVALRAPQKPMTAEQLQMWLDEQTIGVARYMMTGRIV